MEEDPKIREKVALAWAVNAHNNMNMESGYSPKLLTFGETNKGDSIVGQKQDEEKRSHRKKTREWSWKL